MWSWGCGTDTPSTLPQSTHRIGTAYEDMHVIPVFIMGGESPVLWSDSFNLETRGHRKYGEPEVRMHPGSQRERGEHLGQISSPPNCWA